MTSTMTAGGIGGSSPKAGTAGGVGGSSPQESTVTPLAITGCGVVTAAGLGLSRLGELLTEGLAADSLPYGDEAAQFPPVDIRGVSELRLADHVGRKGTRHLDRMTAFGLVACKLALAGTRALVDEEEQSRTGVVLGTSTGSIRTTSELGRETLTEARPYLLNPSQFPNTVMNACAGQIAIWNSLRGVNATVAAGRLSSLHAVRYARTAISHGRAARLLVGGVEELSPQLAWAWHHSKALPENTALGEGCAMFVVEDAAAAAERGRAALAEIYACEARYCSAPGPLSAALTDGLASCIERALTRSGVRPDDVDTVSLGTTKHSGLGAAERRAVRRVLGRVPAQVQVADALGECYSASAALQLAALLALWSRESSESPRVAMVTSVGLDRNVGCLVVRKGQPDGSAVEAG